MPAKAGIQTVSDKLRKCLDSRLRGNDDGNELDF